MRAPVDLPPPPLGPRGRLWVGYSGGLDSTVLLDLLHAAGAPVRAVHVHHGLQSSADNWVRHCRRFCRARDIPLRVLHVIPARRHEQGPEAAAREARYDALRKLLREGDVLATAHHRGDQAETVLMRALRGTGIAGLGAMCHEEPLGAGLLWRPLLDRPRDKLRQHARRQGLEWVEDPHNAAPRYTRAFLRQRVWPVLDEHFPAATAQLARLAAHARDTGSLLADIAAEDAGRCAQGQALRVSALLALSPQRRRNLLYHRWCALGLLPPPASWYAELERSVLRARADATPLLACGDGEARRYRDGLYLMRSLPPPPTGQVLRWPRGRIVELPDGCGRVCVARRPPAGSTVGFAGGGERIRLDENGPARLLTRLCQQAGLPPWLRERMPLLWHDGELLAAGGRWQAPAARRLGLQMRWEHTLPEPSN